MKLSLVFNVLIVIIYVTESAHFHDAMMFHRLWEENQMYYLVPPNMVPNNNVQYFRLLPIENSLVNSDMQFVPNVIPYHVNQRNFNSKICDLYPWYCNYYRHRWARRTFSSKDKPTFKRWQKKKRSNEGFKRVNKVQINSSLF
jgi:hypothetical protein